MHPMVHMWKSESNLCCWPSILFEAESLIACFGVPQAGQSSGFQAVCVFYLPIETLGSLHPDFLWSLEIQTQVPMVIQQTLYLLSPRPCPPPVLESSQALLSLLDCTAPACIPISDTSSVSFLG